MLTWLKRKKGVEVDYAFRTDPGGRDVNQDNLFMDRDSETGRLAFVVADGLGGHAGGETASKLAVETVGPWLLNGRGACPDLLAQALEAAHNVIVMQANERAEQKDMKTTCVALLLDNGSAYWGSVGDSRLYLFRKGEVVEQTKDHSVVQLMVDAGDITQKEAKHHSERNKVYQVLGGREKPRPFITKRGFPLESGDSFLLCTDGFWEYVFEEKMARFIERNSTAGCERLLEKVYRKAKRLAEKKNAQYDNLTAQLVMVL